MLEAGIFKLKYDTEYAQSREESFLDEVSEDDRENYEDCEILTGKNRNGKINKFNNFGKGNKGKKYKKSGRCRAKRSLERFNDEKITADEERKIWELFWEKTLSGDFQFAKLLKEIMVGKEEEKVNVKIDGNVNVKLNIPSKFNKSGNDNINL